MRAYEKAEALGAHPDMLAAWKMDLLLNSGNYERGLSLATDARARNPGHGAWLVHMGRFLYRMGRIEEARRKFEEGLRLSPRHVWVVFVVIQHFLLMGDLDRAEDAYNTYVAPIPDFVQYWPGDALRGRLSLARGNPVPLQSIVVDWVGSRDKNHVPAWAISDILYSLSRYEDHIHWFAVRVEERDLLSWVMDELRQRPQYREELLNWARSNPEHVTERVQVVDEHLSLVDRVTDNMVL
jgi:tetratricopeptide (TPR) repeat protein